MWALADCLFHVMNTKLLIEDAVECDEVTGIINSDLTIGVDITRSKPLRSNQDVCFMGMTLVGKGFRLLRPDIDSLGLDVGDLPPVVRPYLKGKDIIRAPENRWVIDAYGMTEPDLREKYPSLFQRLADTVRDERKQNKRKSYQDKWWLFGEPRAKLRSAIKGLQRYIVTIETSKYKPFTFIEAEYVPDHKLYAIASSDAFLLGVLSSSVHLVWALACGGSNGVGNDPTWTNSTCFDPFPFPDCCETVKADIRRLAEQLDTHRKRQQIQHPKLELTDIYNVLAKLRSKLPLTDKERAIHQRGLLSVLKEIHDDLDAAVLEAYGWPNDLNDQDILRRLVDLNRERTEEEKRGVIRWLRPEYQNPEGAQATAAKQDALPIESEAPRAIPAMTGEKRPWPKSLPEQAQAVRSMLAEQPNGITPEQLARSFFRANTHRVADMLNALVSLGQRVCWREVDTSRSDQINQTATASRLVSYRYKITNIATSVSRGI